MQPSTFRFVVAGCTIAPALLIVAANVRSSARQPVRLARIDGVTMYVPMTSSDTSRGVENDTNQTKIAGVSSAKCLEQEFDFGVVEPMRAHRHTFGIHNVGTAPLTLARLGTSCKCLKVDVRDPMVAPGGTGHVDIVWEATPNQEVFLQRATLETNDPANEVIELKIKGRARLILAAEPPTLVVGRIKPHEQAEASTTVVSQVWDEFNIERVHSSLEGLTWSLSPAEPQELQRLNGKSGWRLAVKYPANMPTGTIDESLRITARPVGSSPSNKHVSDAAAGPLEREIPLGGTVLRRLAVYGKDIQPWGVIEAGNVNPPRGYHAQFVLKVNDDERELRVTAIETIPKFVEARIKPYAGGKPGLYRLLVNIPPSGPAGVYRGDNAGRITVKFDHPRIESLELGLDFVVMKRSPRGFSGSNVAMAARR